MKPEIMNDYRQQLYLEGKADRTIEVYEKNIELFFDFISGDQTDLDLSTLNRITLMQFVKHCSEVGNTNATINLKLSALASLMLFMYNRRLIDEPIHKDAISLKSHEFTYTNIAAFSPTEYEVLNEIVLLNQNPTHILMFYLLSAGIKPGNVQRLTLNDLGIDLAESSYGDSIDIRYPHYTERISTDRNMVAAIQDLIRHRRFRPSPSNRVFINEKRKPYELPGIRYVFKNYMSKAGLSKEYTLNAFRHFYIIEALKKDIALVDICRRTNLSLDYLSRTYSFIN